MPHVSRFSERPATSVGHWAGRTALIAFATIFTSAVVNVVFEGPNESTADDVFKLTVVTIFTLSGVSALVLSVRSLMLRERSFAVWAALVVGLLATLLMIAEFTVME